MQANATFGIPHLDCMVIRGRRQERAFRFAALIPTNREYAIVMQQGVLAFPSAAPDLKAKLTGGARDA